MTYYSVALPGTSSCELHFATYATDPVSVAVDAWMTEVTVTCPWGIPMEGFASLINTGCALTRTGLIYSTAATYLPRYDDPGRITSGCGFFGEPPVSGPGGVGPAGTLAEVVMYGSFAAVPPNCASTMLPLVNSPNSDPRPALVCTWDATVALVPNNASVVSGVAQTCAVPRATRPAAHSTPQPSECYPTIIGQTVPLL